MGEISHKRFEEQFERLMEVAGCKTEADLARILDIAPPSITGAKRRRMIPVEWFNTIADKFCVSSDFLRTGRSFSDKSESHARVVVRHRFEKPEPIEVKDEHEPMLKTIEPYTDTDTGTLIYSENNEDGVSMSLGYFAETLKADPTTCVFMRYPADDMSPDIQRNDLVLIDTSKDQRVMGKLYVMILYGTIVIGRARINANGFVFERSNGEDIELGKMLADKVPFKMIGTVIWIGRECN